MSYQFIFGDFAGGKTEYIYETIIRLSQESPEKSFYIMVPEQNALRVQQELIKRHPRHGMLNMDVLSFNLLSYRVMDELGIKKPDILDEVSKSMILRDVCERISDELIMYRSKLGKTGFINQLKSALSEFYRYGVTPDELRNAAERTDDNILKSKIHDISAVFEAFREEIKGRYAAAEEIPELLLHNLPKSHIPDGAVFFFDGFTGYTGVQLKIIEEIMLKAESVSFAVTFPEGDNPYKRDTGRLRAADIYYLSRETVASVTDIASRAGISKAEDVRILHRGTHETRLFSCADPEEEVRAAVSYIERLVRKNGLRYRDIAVALADEESYSRTVDRLFREAGVPCFMDRKEQVIDNAAAEYIRSAVETCRSGFSEEAVLRYIKSPFSGREGLAEAQEERRELRLLKDRTDNYIRALGLKGRKRLGAEWSAVYAGAEDLDLIKLNGFKDELLEPLFALSDGLKSEKISNKTESIFKFIEDTELYRKISILSAGMEADGRSSEAKKQEQVFESVVELLNGLSALMGDRRMSIRDFRNILDAGFSEIKIGRIPATLDQVIVGDLKRSRFEGIKVLIMLGVNDGLIPSTVSGGGIFRDRERAELLAEDLELAPADAEDSCIQRFYLAMNMAKPESVLALFFSRSDASGKALRPSEVIYDTCRGIKAKDGSELLFIKTGNEALSELALLVGEEIRAEKENGETGYPGGKESERIYRLKELFRHLLRDGELGRKAEKILRAALPGAGKEGPALLDRETACRLYGDVLYGSVTRIENYESCPYKHFLRYGLRLLERRQADIEASDIGNLYHSAIETAFRMIDDEGLEFSDISDDELARISRECVLKVTTEYNNSMMRSSERNLSLAERVNRITGRTLSVLKRQMRKGDFKIYGCELPFKYTSDNLSLHGRIDRVDSADDGGRIYVKVIDYKSGRTKFDLSRIWHGMQLQLVIYMDIALKRSEAGNRGREAVPAGIFYYNIDDPVVDYAEGMSREDIDGSLFKSLRMNGLVNSDMEAIAHLDRDVYENEGESEIMPLSLKDGRPQKRGSSAADTEGFRALSRFAEKKMHEASAEILGGNIDIRPFRSGSQTGCDYCPYHSVCGFDTRLEGFNYKNLGSIKADEFWERIYGEDEVDR